MVKTFKHTHKRKQELKYKWAKVDIRFVSTPFFKALEETYTAEALTGGKIDHNKLRKFLAIHPEWKIEFTELELE
jgi:hypothetical protein